MLKLRLPHEVPSVPPRANRRCHASALPTQLAEKKRDCSARMWLSSHPPKFCLLFTLSVSQMNMWNKHTRKEIALSLLWKTHFVPSAVLGKLFSYISGSQKKERTGWGEDCRYMGRWSLFAILSVSCDSFCQTINHMQPTAHYTRGEFPLFAFLYTKFMNIVRVQSWNILLHSSAFFFFSFQCLDSSVWLYKRFRPVDCEPTLWWWL